MTLKIMTVTVKSVKLQSNNNMTVDFFHHVQLQLQSLYLHSRHFHHLSFVIIWTCFLKSLESQLHSPPPHLTPLPSPPSFHHLCSLTIYNAIQGAHGLDGRPGPVVSGASPTLVPSPFSSSSSSSSTPPCYSLLDVCLSCPLAFLLTMPVLSLCLPEVALWKQDCLGSGSEDALAWKILFQQRQNISPLICL